eukprot:7376254-Prymnesium_polylepis.3
MARPRANSPSCDGRLHAPSFARSRSSSWWRGATLTATGRCPRSPWATRGAGRSAAGPRRPSRASSLALRCTEAARAGGRASSSAVPHALCLAPRAIICARQLPGAACSMQQRL